MYSERDIISLFRQILGGRLYDDVGYSKIGDEYILYNIDTFVKSTDAPLNMNYYYMGWKSVVGAVSDVYVKGGEPRYLSISINLPVINIDEIKELARGIKDVISEYNLEIVKWDTNRSNDLSISVSVVGFSNNPPVLRKGADVGDIIVVTDYFGLERLGLELLMNKIEIDDDKLKKTAITRFLKPFINKDKYRRVFSMLSVHAAIDSSDGLARSLWEISTASNKIIKIKTLPIHPLVKQYGFSEKYIREITLYGGEEYTGLFSIPKDEETICKKLGLIPIGEVVTTGIGVYDENNVEIMDRGWLHRF